MRSQCIIIALLMVPALMSGQLRDDSDSLWSIVVPVAEGLDVDMGQVPVGSVRDSVVTAFLRNTGGADVRIEEIRFTGADAGLFSLRAGIPPYSIKAGGSRAVEFSFSPLAAGVKSAGIVITTQADALHRNIRGEGVIPSLMVETRIVDFGAVQVGGRRDTAISVMIRNTGSTAIRIDDTGQLGPDKEQFEILSGGAPFVLQPLETRSMSLRFAPKYAGRSSGSIGFHYDGNASPAVARLYGEGLSAASVAVLSADTVRGIVGEVVEIPIRLLEQENLLFSGATGFYSELDFDVTVLVPFGATPEGRVVEGKRIIALDNLPLQPDAGGALLRLEFLVTLGEAEGTVLRLRNSIAIGGDVAVAGLPGYFLVEDLCREGGVRLFSATGALELSSRPNPFNTTTLIEYEVIEKGWTQVYVLDLSGRKISTIVASTLLPGRYSAMFNAEGLASGIYICVLLTPSQVLARRIELLK